MIAALYVQTDGAYYGLPDVDPWDEQRDARLYAGPWSVVAHPPCEKWSPLAYINQRRIPDYHVGDDGGCFASALHAVNTWGGVLEHPANSVAWRTFGLTKPRRGMWLNLEGGWVTEVDQGRYGHRARKRTWLYVNAPEPAPLDWTVAESDAIVSGFTHQAKGEHVACEHRRVRPKEASRTPDAFRDVLLAIARGKGEAMGQVNRKGEKPSSSPALDAELRRRKSAERRAPSERDAPRSVSTLPPHKPPVVHAGQLSLATVAQDSGQFAGPQTEAPSA